MSLGLRGLGKLKKNLRQLQIPRGFPEGVVMNHALHVNVIKHTRLIERKKNTEHKEYVVVQIKGTSAKLTISVLKDNSLSRADKCEKKRSFSNILDTW